MGITHLSGLQVGGVPTMGMGGLPPFTGRWYFVDPAHGSDGNEGTADSPYATLYKAYAVARSGYNDVIVLVGDGSTTGTARLSVALAQTVDSTATTGTITWAKNALHLIGMTAPTGIGQRARIAPPSGTYTAATFGNTGNLFNVTAQGCYFANFSIFGGFSTGNASSITWKAGGGRNYYWNVHFQGIADAASAGGTGARSVQINGSTGENTFENCTFGIDTVTRSVANYSLEFENMALSPRNRFFNCDFPFMTSSATTGGIYAATDGIDRFALFEGCRFINATIGGPASTGMTNLLVAQTTATGGVYLFNNCLLMGITNYAATGAGVAQTYVNAAVPNGDTGGVAVVSVV